MALVLGVVGGILAGIWGLVNTVQENSRQDMTVSYVTQIVQNVRDVYKGMMATPAGDLTNNLINRSAIVSDMIKSRTAPFTAGHLWDNTVAGGTFAVLASPVDRSNFFIIQFSRLPQSACIGLASKLSGDQGPRDRISLQINAAAAVGGAVSPEVAAGDCLANSNNTLTFVYRLR